MTTKPEPGQEARVVHQIPHPYPHLIHPRGTEGQETQVLNNFMTLGKGLDGSGPPFYNAMPIPDLRSKKGRVQMKFCTWTSFFLFRI